jgi:catalase (peroxidase I)
MGNSNGSVSQRQVAMAQDFDAIRRDVLKVMDEPEWDDGSYAPVLIRLGWHSSGTYDSADNSGGTDGATMRHELEANDPDNAGLGKARQLLDPIKAKYPGLALADLWVLAAYCAIEHTGGPKIPFTGGRIDAPKEKAIAPGRLPNPERGSDPGLEVDSEGRVLGWEKNAAHIRDVFGRMGFNDREMVALICGGHVYGRCHTESSGYAGAWVENPTFFSNEYAADMFGDKWILVGHDSKLPDGRPVPEEIRPAPGKRQYIDLSKLIPDEEEEKNTAAPDSENFPPGAYVCMSQWVNIRDGADVTSPIIGRCVQDVVVNLVAVKVFGTAVRGRAERGGWVSIIGSAGKTLFERKGDFDGQIMAGKYRRLDQIPTFDSTQATGSGKGSISTTDFTVTAVAAGSEDNVKGAVFGKTNNGDWALLYSPKRGQLAELIVEGYNEKVRKPIKGQDGNQMMLISDMVMMWDPSFCKVLQEYADDQEVLSRDFGLAFKRLTELGCPWSKDGGKDKMFIESGGGCPFACRS